MTGGEDLAAEHRPPLSELARHSPRFWLGVDVVLAAHVLAVTLVEAHIARHAGPNGAAWDVVRDGAIVVACGSFPFRRKYPHAALWLVAPAVAVLLPLGVREPVLAIVGLAVYSVAASEGLSRWIVGALVAVMWCSAIVAADGPEWGWLIGGPAVVLAGWLAGENTRARAAYARGAAERAAEREREREERIRQAAFEERVRIARELHDIVAHAMSVIAVRSGVARMVADTDPGEAHEALGIIETTSRRALQEMRRLVGVLRQPADTTAELAPAPGLDGVPDLIADVAHAGVAVRMCVEGEVRHLPPGVDVSAYRIVQEALTNVIRHAGSADTDVFIRYRRGEVEIEVVDDAGPGEPAPVMAGHGLVGMQERVGLYHGELIAGPTARGFRVLARIPTDSDDV